MLCISMRAGDYFTVGQTTVVQFDRLTGDRVHLTINAPREVPILRGDVLERGGGQRPGCVLDTSPRAVKQLLPLGRVWEKDFTISSARS